MSADERVQRFVQRCAEAQPGTLFNPWSQVCEMDIAEEAPRKRRERLIAHLSRPGVRLVLIGEAAGYAGCRFSGVPFTSERLLLEGRIPGVHVGGGGRITRRRLPFSEPSATIVWSALHSCQAAESTVLWNVVPWHPWQPGSPLSNRTPNREEKAMGIPFLQDMLALFPDALVGAVGNISAQALNDLGVCAVKIRHPARGGATAFREGVKALSSNGCS